ncbi:Tryptophan synthase alpha chain [Klebsiella pneumoniae IS43]|uniref:tryptophan synthase n=1 Tax=Klebsiella pneumoniae IS43 TaxID=1432552 RepID=W1DJ54_KLEPN|nr:Tryptophan synthase alpha chain [Klebsiella pneumoniae IS43]
MSAAIDAGAAGAISGSAIVKIIERHLDEPQTMLDELKAFVQSLKAATKNRLTISRLVSRQAAISTRYLPFHVILHANTSDGPMIDTLTPGDAL